MRVKIEHQEIRTGFVFKKTFHEVHVTVDFSHEERQIIRQRGLGDHVLMERVPAGARPDDNPDWYVLKVSHLVDRKPDRFRCENPSAAKVYAQQVTGCLHSMKAWFDDNAETGTTTVFEI